MTGAKTKPTKAELIEELGRAFRAEQNRGEAFDELAARLMGINKTDLRCVDIVEQHGRISAGKLAELMGLTTGAVTGVLDRLERIGYARRVRGTEDRRSVLVELTDRGREATWRIYGPMGAEWEAFLSRYTMDELKFLLGMLRASEEVGLRQIERLRAQLP